MEARLKSASFIRREAQHSRVYPMEVVEESPVIEPGSGANESSETKRPDWDKSIDTSPNASEAEADPAKAEEEPKIEAESPPADDGNVDEKKPRSAEERIVDLTKKWRTTERENEALLDELALLRRQQADSSEAAQPFRSRSEFQSEDEYNVYLSNEVEARAEIAAEAALAKQTEAAKRDEIGESFAEREKVFAEENPDYLDLVYDRNLKISEAMKDVIQTDENGLDLAVYLGKNPDIAKDIFSMTDVGAGVKMSRILADIGSEKAKASAPPVSKAPPPVPQIATSETSLEKDPADMTDKEFAKWRRKQIANR